MEESLRKTMEQLEKTKCKKQRKMLSKMIETKFKECGYSMEEFKACCRNKRQSYLLQRRGGRSESSQYMQHP